MLKVKKVSYRCWEVPSESKKGVVYSVCFDPKDGKLHCTCKGYTVHGTICKHIRAVRQFLVEERKKKEEKE